MAQTSIALRPRHGPPPETMPGVPHLQLSQNSPPAIRHQLWQRMTSLDDVLPGRSAISVPDSRALHLEPNAALGPPEAFLVRTEFAHLHAEGSLHVSLPTQGAEEAMAQGWAEPHPVVSMGLGPANWVMLYGPRDADELDVIWGLVRASHSFASRASLPSQEGGDEPDGNPEGRR